VFCLRYYCCKDFVVVAPVCTALQVYSSFICVVVAPVFTALQVYSSFIFVYGLSGLSLVFRRGECNDCIITGFGFVSLI
jgi:hypothetical protein